MRRPNISASPSATARWLASWSASAPPPTTTAAISAWFRERYPRFLLHRPHRRGQPPPRRRRGPRLLRRRAELCRAAISAAGLRSVPGPRRRSGAAVPWQFRLQGGGPEPDARRRPPRQHADEGALQLRLGTRNLRRCPARPDRGRAAARWQHPLPQGRAEHERDPGEPGLRTGRRTQDRPGRHRQPARAHAGCGAIVAGDARTGRSRAEAVRPRGGDHRFRWPDADARCRHRQGPAGRTARRRACCRSAWPTARRKPNSLAEQLGLPLLAKFRAQYEPVGGAGGDAPPAGTSDRAANPSPPAETAKRRLRAPAAPAWCRPPPCVPASSCMRKTAT